MHGEMNESQQSLNEIDFLRQQIKSIAESDAFKSLEGQSKIQQTLAENKQAHISDLINKFLAEKIASMDQKSDD